MTLEHEFRYAVDTYTRLRVPHPEPLSPGAKARGLAVGPVVGATLGLVGGLPLLLGTVDLMAHLVRATLVVALAAWLTRARHWVGLASLADGLGSGAPAADALDEMRRPEIGPFGVLTLGFTVAVQVLCLARLPSGAAALAAWLVAVAAGRMAVAVAAGPWVAAATPDSRGGVVGAVSTRLIGVAVALTLVVGAVEAASGYLSWPVALVAAPGVAVGIAVTLSLIAGRRLGGSTDAVLDATAELATTAALLAVVFL